MKLFINLNCLISRKVSKIITDEKRLLRAIQSERQEEPEVTFQYLYTKYKSLVCFIVAQYVRNESDIEDITQETFINFFNHVENIHSSIKSYLTVSAKNIAFNFVKKNARLNYVDTDELSNLYNDSPNGDYFANDRFDELVNDMKRVLSEEDVKIILLHLIDDVKFEEIALQLNQNEKTVKTKYYRALKKYKKMKGAE